MRAETNDTRVRAEAIDAHGRETMGAHDADVHVPMGSLPRVFRPALSAFPPAPAWLVPDPDRAAAWAARLGALGAGLKVGLAWTSGYVTRERSAAYTTLDQWAPVFAVPGLRLVTLQYGDREAEIRAAEQRFGVTIHRWPDLDLKDDFEGVAALAANLDLVVSVAVSAGELAGALGVPVWRVGGADWTQLGSAARPWFPAMRLFQPPPGGTLGDALARAAADLAALARA